MSECEGLESYPYCCYYSLAVVVAAPVVCTSRLRSMLADPMSSRAIAQGGIRERLIGRGLSSIANICTRQKKECVRHLPLSLYLLCSSLLLASHSGMWADTFCCGSYLLVDEMCFGRVQLGLFILPTTYKSGIPLQEIHPRSNNVFQQPLAPLQVHLHQIESEVFILIHTSPFLRLCFASLMLITAAIRRLCEMEEGIEDRLLLFHLRDEKFEGGDWERKKFRCRFLGRHEQCQLFERCQTGYGRGGRVRPPGDS